MAGSKFMTYESFFVLFLSYLYCFHLFKCKVNKVWGSETAPIFWKYFKVIFTIWSRLGCRSTHFIALLLGKNYSLLWRPPTWFWQDWVSCYPWLRVHFDGTLKFALYWASATGAVVFNKFVWMCQNKNLPYCSSWSLFPC